MERGVQAQPANSGEHDKRVIVSAKHAQRQSDWRRMRKSGGRVPPTGKESEVEARVIASRYALALKRRNQRLRSDARAKAAALDEGDAVRSSPKTKIWISSAPPTNLKDRRVAQGKLHSIPRPPFPVRIAPSSAIESGQLIRPSHQRILRIEDINSSNGDWCGRYEDDELGPIAGDNVTGALLGLDCQLQVIEARGRSILRRQEQYAQSQTLVALEMLQSKLDQVQEASLPTSRQKRHAKDRVEQVSNPRADVPKKLLHRVVRISELLAPLEIALNQLSCPGFMWSPFQLQQDVEALTLELDHLLELAKASGSGFVVRTDQKLGSTLLQAARLVKELGVEMKARTTNVNDNI